MKYLLLFLLFISVASCGVKSSIIEAKKEKKQFPEVGNKQTSLLGEALTYNQDISFYESIIINTDIGAGRFSKNVKFEKGEELILSSQTKDYLLYSNGFDGVAIPKSNGKVKYFTKNLYDQIEFLNLSDKLDFTKSTHEDKKLDSFRQEFIYNGKSGNGLKFTYREYINDLARPAFSQDVQYDLSESKEIGFKNLLIEVIDANNTSITYKVLKHF